MLKEGTRSGSVGDVRRLKRDFLMVGQVAMALALVISAGLMIKSFVRIKAADAGFDTQGILTMRTRLSGERYQSAERRMAFFDQAIRKIRSRPGVTSAAAVSTLPCDGLDTWDYATIEGHTERRPGSKIFLGKVTVTPGYFETMRVPLVSGRDFTELDSAEGQNVVIVNETLAQRFWPDGGAIGRRLKYGALDSDAPWLTVVGVVGDVKQRGLTRATRLETYRPYTQRPNWRMSFAVRTAGDPLAATAAVRTAVWEVDRDRAVYRVRSMEDIVFDEIGVWGFMAGLLAVFAAIALGLACVGLYGVISYTVSRRTHEIGIRKALGAQSRHVVWLVVGRCVLLTLAGVGVGLCLALLSGRALESLMYGVSPTDPLTFTAVSVMMIAVGVLASYIPSRRATKVDPMVALRYE
jgi:putative ABC transport system permease protein